MSVRKSCLVAFGCCWLCAECHCQADDLPMGGGEVTEESLDLESGIEGPEFEVSVDLSSRQITYGLVDNRDPIVTAGVLAEWYGFTFLVESIHDLTHWGRKHGGYGNRKFRYQEIAFGPGYVLSFSPDEYEFMPTELELSIDYIYEYHPAVKKWRGEENPNTQFINLGAALPELFLRPALNMELDLGRDRESIYLEAEIGHTFALVGNSEVDEENPLTFSLGAGVGAGNRQRNKNDLDVGIYAFKDVWASAALEWHITEWAMLSPYVLVSEQLHRRLRHEAREYIEDQRHASTQVIWGVSLVMSF